MTDSEVILYYLRTRSRISFYVKHEWMNAHLLDEDFKTRAPPPRALVINVYRDWTNV